MQNILKSCKKQILEEIGEENIHELKFVKLLKLIKPVIQELSKYWTLGQIWQMINNEFELKISKTVFYDFCSKNLKKEQKDKKFDPVKRDKKEEVESFKNIDDLTDSTLDFLSKNLPKK